MGIVYNTQWDELCCSHHELACGHLRTSKRQTRKLVNATEGWETVVGALAAH